MRRSDWKRVTRSHPCPICTKPDWCLYAGPDGDPDAAICARIESEKRCGEAGWLHRLRDDDFRLPRRRQRKVRQRSAPVARPELARLAESCIRAVDDDALAELADGLGVSVDALQRVGIGWTTRESLRQATGMGLSSPGCWTFPMRDAAGGIVGVRLRLPSGKKLSIRGSREGLFLPVDLPRGERLLVCEGPTDTAALLDLGFAAVGRPSCTGGVRLLVDLLGRLRPVETVIVADADPPGRRGADNLASVLTAYCPAVRVITPPPEHKDARNWKRAGATGELVAAAISAAPARQLKVKVNTKWKRKD